MASFDYVYTGDPVEIGDYPDSTNCPFCKTMLQYAKIPHHTHSDRLIREIMQLKEGDFPRPNDLLYSSFDWTTWSQECYLMCCGACGWWRHVIDVSLSVQRDYETWHLFFGSIGILKPMDLKDMNIPIDEVSRYLVAKYEERFSVNPKLFEEVVANVFKQLGYHVRVTGYSNDGGIDSVLERADGSRIGVQVKRYKNKIKVEQIRAFAGALILGGMTRGIFVTTSDFQPGALKAAVSFSDKALLVELKNAYEFYEELKLVQQQQFDIEEKKAFLLGRPLKLYHFNCDEPDSFFVSP